MRVGLFLAAGFATFLLDNGIFWMLERSTGLLFVPLAVSTAASVAFNYLVVRRLVFKTTVDHARALPKFLGVHFTGLLIRFASIITVTAAFHIPNIAAKWIADGIVYAAKYFIQRDFVFNGGATRSAAPGSSRSVPQPQSESIADRSL